MLLGANLRRKHYKGERTIKQQKLRKQKIAIDIAFKVFKINKHIFSFGLIKCSELKINDTVYCLEMFLLFVYKYYLFIYMATNNGLIFDNFIPR